MFHQPRFPFSVAPIWACEPEVGRSRAIQDETEICVALLTTPTYGPVFDRKHKLGFKQKKDRLEQLDVDMYTDTPPPGKPATKITNRMAFSCRREQN